jgi:thymidylate synthase
MSVARFSIILAETPSHGIGNHVGPLPWGRIQAEYDYFKSMIRGKTILCGRKTWEAMGRPKNAMVLSRTIEDHLPVFPSLGTALAAAEAAHILILGGAEIYNEAMMEMRDRCDEIFLSRIYKDYPCDVHWRGVDEHYFVEDPSYRKEYQEFSIHRYVVHPEYQYLDLVRRIVSAPHHAIQDRTGVGTVGIFGHQMRFDLRLGFPLLTTKLTRFTSIKEELLWFIAGSTNAQRLAARGVHIWDANATKEFLESRGLGHYEDGELGPIYGHQWRNWGGDQLKQCIEQLKTEPHSRRIIMSAWNVEDLPKMALPPCHVMVQFSARPGSEAAGSRILSSHLYQRSADVGLGLPFNIASYALLTHMVAQVCDMQVGELTISIGDAHVYANHVDKLKQVLLTRRPLQFCTLKLNPAVMDIDGFTSEDIAVVGYKCHQGIKLEMAV